MTPFVISGRALITINGSGHPSPLLDTRPKFLIGLGHPSPPELGPRFAGGGGFANKGTEVRSGFPNGTGTQGGGVAKLHNPR